MIKERCQHGLPVERTDRDLRIDFVRGAALLTICSDHIDGNVVASFTLYSFGFADMSEVFVFVSGFVGAIVYARRLDDHGFWPSQKRAVWRTVKIYCAHLLGLATLISALLCIRFISPGSLTNTGRWCETILISPWQFISNMVLLRNQPWEFAALPLYMVLVPLLPAIAMIARSNGVALLTASSAIYLSTQLWPNQVSLPNPWKTACFFNPFSWQLLFCAGAIVALRREWEQLVRRRATVFVAGLCVEACLLWATAIPRNLIPFIDKASLGPLRLGFFACLFIIAASLARHIAQWSHSKLFWPLIICGQNPLAVFCVGSLFACFVNSVVPFSPTRAPQYLLLNSFGWLACIAAAFLSQTISNRLRARRLW